MTPPKFWFIKMSDMNKSKHLELFKKWFNEKSGCIWQFGADEYGYSGREECNGYDTYPLFRKSQMTLLSPDEWYDMIYDVEKLRDEEGFTKEAGDRLLKRTSDPENVGIGTFTNSSDLINALHNKNLTYETQYLRSDGVLFTREKIGDTTVEELKEERKRNSERNKVIDSLLRSHKNKF